MNSIVFILSFGFSYFVLIGQLNAAVFSLRKKLSPTEDSAVILYLSDHLVSLECYGLIDYLINQSQNPEDARQKLLKIVGDDPQAYPCHEALKFWNEDLLQSKFKPAELLDNRRDIADKLLVLGLKHVHREDLQAWLEKLNRDRMRQEITKLQTKWSRHVKDGLAEKEGKEIPASDNAKHSKIPDQPNPMIVNIMEAAQRNKSVPAQVQISKEEHHDTKFPEKDAPIYTKEKKEFEKWDSILYVTAVGLSGVVLILIIFVVVVKYKSCRAKRLELYEYEPFQFDDDEDDDDESSWTL